jgi:hypothetical protein
MKKQDLKLKAPAYKDEVEVLITGDYNDADYVTETSLISLAEYEKLRPIFEKIIDARKKRIPYHNWEDREEYLTKKELQEIEDLSIPYAEEGIHSIVSIRTWFLSKDDNVRYDIIS